MQKEKEIENNILMFLGHLGLFCWKNQSVGVYNVQRGVFMRSRNIYHIKGVSDILGLMPDGRMLAIEVKSKTGRISPEQMKFITLVNKNGGVAFVSRSIQQTWDQLKTHLKDPERFDSIVSKYKYYAKE